MSIFKNLRNVAASAYIAMGKVQDSMPGFNDNENIRHEQQIRKEYINLLSKKRFYNILERSEEIRSRKILGEDRSNDVNRTFKNKRHGSFMESTDGDENVPFKLKTNNSLGQYCDYVSLIEEQGNLVLEFVVNTVNNPSVRFTNFNDLTHLTLNENGKTFSFNVIKYLGTIQKSNYEISLYYQGVIEKFGEYDFELDDSPRILTSKDCPPKNTVNYR